ncbi:MAG: tRNA (adenosine(37)-N6)-dimethylallyltransferase MiaA [Hyphomicrobiales bacterium]
MKELYRMSERAVLIAGPTASGKSSLALFEADRVKRAGLCPIIVNADSMQVYRELRIISARPSLDDEAQVKHVLYGFVSSKEVFNTGRWLDEMGELLAGLAEDELPIIVGGTGLYFKALLEGFARIPDIADEVRAGLRALFLEENAEKMHQRLAAVDPQMADSLKPTDAQRILRALEVYEATGKSILHWQQEAQASPLLSAKDCRKIIALPERDVLYERINARFDAMVDEGALEEVAALAKLQLDWDLPAMKAIGVPQFMAHLEGTMPLEDAILDAKQESRRYAKRQMTWLRNQMGEDWQRIDVDDENKRN